MDDPSAVGTKAAGLLNLHRSWVPTFHVLPVRPVTEFSHLTALADEIAEGLESSGLQSLGCAVMVRSSAPDESLAERGRLLTRSSECSAWPVAHSAALIAKHARQQGQDRLGLVLQRKVTLESKGHLSNERRLTSSARRWMVESEAPWARSAWLEEVSPAPGRPLPGHTLLRGLEELPLGALRTVAEHLTFEDRRCHVEWVSDGQQIWVVQVDSEHRVTEPEPMATWAASDGPTGPMPSSTRTLHRIEDSAPTWRKARNVQGFAALGLPTAPMWILDDPGLIAELAAGRCPPHLRDDLSQLLVRPLVVRSDVQSSSTDSLVLNPRSDCSIDLDTTIDFLRATARGLTARRDVTAVAFLIHHFLPAAAGAWAYADPDHPRVRIDATWGVPDSLLYCPHDTFTVDLRDPDRVSEQIRCKESFIDVEPSGRWVKRRTGWDHDWRPSLDRSMAREIAEGAHRIAVDRGTAVAVMFFARLATGPGLPSTLPWHVEGAAPTRAPTVRTFGQRSRVLITRPEDLRQVHTAFTGAARRPAETILLLDPEVESLRDTDFIREVAELARRFDQPLILRGSILSHVHYLLSDAGVEVFTDFEREERGDPAERLMLNKLVRDHVPTVVQGRSEDTIVLRVSGDDHLNLLRLKAIEEGAELLFADGADQVEEELADLYEVLLAICAVRGTPLDAIVRLAEAKRRERGGFTDGVVLVATQGSDVGASGQLTPATSDVRSRPGRLRASVSTTEASVVDLSVPFRSVSATGFDMLVARTRRPSGTWKVRIKFDVDGLTAQLRWQPTKQRNPNQLTLLDVSGPDADDHHDR